MTVGFRTKERGGIMEVMIVTRRDFLGAAAASVFVPQFGRWFAPPRPRILMPNPARLVLLKDGKPTSGVIRINGKLCNEIPMDMWNHIQVSGAAFDGLRVTGGGQTDTAWALRAVRPGSTLTMRLLRQRAGTVAVPWGAQIEEPGH